ncbi:MAG: hypothetical protein JWQ12_901 [Glaciihabitans sp.]|nr:hypothetical protein [Glaciihabitans sp.]
MANDDLTISGGGSVVVASDAMRAQVERLQRLGGRLASARASVAGLTAALPPGLLRAWDAPISALAANRELERAGVLLGAANASATALATEVRAALEAYGLADRVVGQLAQDLTTTVAWGVGFLAPVLLPAAMLFLGVVAYEAVAEAKLTNRSLGQWANEHNALLCTPGFVALARQVVMGLGPAGAGLARLPPGVAENLSQGAEPFGMAAAAGVVLAILRPLGLGNETPVSVKQTTKRKGVPGPVTFADRASRILHPEDSDWGEQVRIDKYTRADGSVRFDVYVSGTIDFGMKTDEPFDMTSNIGGEGRLPAGAYRAVREAMQQAGVTAQTPITLNGYSQGGLIASMVAASGNYNVAGLVTFGSPSGQVPVPPSVPVLTVRHSDDLVPALGGFDTNRQALVVERQVYAHDPVPTDIAVPAHQFFNYEYTAALIDAAGSDELRAAVKRLGEFGAGAVSVETTTYTASRIVTTSGGR